MRDVLFWLSRGLSLYVLSPLLYVLVLPLMFFATPFMILSDRAAAKRIAAMACPWCYGSLSAIKRDNLERVAVRVRVAPGTKIFRDRLPEIKITCPNCQRDICFDQRFRVTTCDRSDAFPERSPATTKGDGIAQGIADIEQDAP